MDQHIIESLSPSERKVLPYLAQASTLAELATKANVSEIEAMRALQWLENKGALSIENAPEDVIGLGENGTLYVEKGLPERRFLQALTDTPQALDAILKKAQLDKAESGICVGQLKKKAALAITQGPEFAITEQGKKLLASESLEEQFLKKIGQQQIPLAELAPEEKFAFDNLKARPNLLKVTTIKTKKILLTDLGNELTKAKIDDAKIIESITPDMLKDGSWKDKTLRRYDVTSPVPKITFGRRQHYKKFQDIVRQKFLAMGFTEMDGPIVESDFWNLDALYIPQFHAARDVHDAYYVKDVPPEDVPERFLHGVRQMHEDGGTTGSRGWKYTFDPKRTLQRVLRTQGTACSARMLADPKMKVPGKYFSIAKCFRYDVIDATHLPDFYQIEGIVAEEGLTFAHLKGLLKQFAKEFCNTDEVKVIPSYFPFTEPSAEIFAKHPDLGWIELGGSGMFRPEVVKPFGIDVPVMAWGIGIDRIGMFNMGIKDIRKLYSHDIEFLRKIKVD